MLSEKAEYLIRHLALPPGDGFREEKGNLIRSDELWSEALEIARGSDARLAFRASWALEAALESAPEKRAELLPVLVTDYIASPNQSVLRSYGKLIAQVLPAHKREFPPEICSGLIEKGLDLLIDPRSDAAVRVWAMEILYLFRDKELVREHLPCILRDLQELVREHLPCILRDLQERVPLPSVRNKASKILRRLGSGE